MKRVLAIDDEKDITEIIQDVLEPLGFRVETKNTAAAAMEAVKGGFRGLVLLDISMPEMDGWGFIQSLVEQGLSQNVVICMLTAIQTTDSKRDPLAGHVLEYIRKPFTPNLLAQTVENLMSLIPEA